MYQLHIRQLAKEDIQEVVDYYENISTLITDNFLENLYSEFDFLRKIPESFQIKYRRTRVIYLERFPFGIHYRILDNNIIEVLAVLHTHRNPKKWKKR